MYEKIHQDAKSHLEQGYKTIAIICKTSDEAENVYKYLGKINKKARENTKIDIKLIDTNIDEVKQGVIVIPAYMSKGLEFDVVFVFNVSLENYNTQLDRRLLYIACTRALHRLMIYYTGKCSDFIQEERFSIR